MLASLPSGARPRGAARREALLDAVLRIVAEVGVDAVTHRRVAEVAGLPLASTTYWFDSKEHLLTAALERAADRDIERLRTLLSDAPEPTADPLDLVVEAVLDPTDESIHASRGWLLATYALLLEAARLPALRDVRDRWTDAYLELLPPLLAAVGSQDPRSDAQLLLAAADGLLLEQLTSGNESGTSPSGTADLPSLAPQLRRLADALVRA
jgi:TetR/AcrR family transcriptional regulator, regulator of biofilm formation and stress response